MANNPPVLVDAATGRPLLSTHDAERDTLLATIANLRASRAAVDAWRTWAEQSTSTSLNLHDEELRARIAARIAVCNGTIDHLDAHRRDLVESLHTMTEALADAVTRAVAAEGEAALLRAALAKRDATISVLRETIAALSEREATITELRAKDRASIVAFLTAETKRIDDAAERVDDEDHGVTEKRLRAQASIGRTWTAQIERGDDRNGADTALVKPAITGRLVTVGQITTCDNDCADSGDYNFTTMSGALIVMDDDSVRAAAGLFGKVIEIRGVG